MLPMPSMVVSSTPSSCDARCRQLFVDTVSGDCDDASHFVSSTVHAPHPPSPQPIFVPVYIIIQCMCVYEFMYACM